MPRHNSARIDNPGYPGYSLFGSVSTSCVSSCTLCLARRSPKVSRTERSEPEQPSSNTENCSLLCYTSNSYPQVIIVGAPIKVVTLQRSFVAVSFVKSSEFMVIARPISGRRVKIDIRSNDKPPQANLN